MENLQKTIARAVSVKGPEILTNKVEFCNLLEDLNPENISERKQLSRLYSDEVGYLLAQSIQAPYDEREKYFREVDRLLQDLYGLTEERRQAFTEIFKTALRKKSVEVQKFKDYKIALRTIKKEYGDHVPEDVIRYFVDDNRLFFRFSLTVEDVERDLKGI